MVEWAKWAVVFVGAGLGGVARFAVGRMIPLGTGELGEFPWATLLVNVAGCLAIGCVAGALVGVSAERAEFWRLGLMVGVLGGFTTFSAFGRETIALLESGRWPLALAYVLSSVILGLIAVAAGLWLTRAGS